MAELRYNPITKDWVMVASHRQARPQMPKDWCPFCPGSGKVPDEGFDATPMISLPCARIPRNRTMWPAASLRPVPLTANAK